MFFDENILTEWEYRKLGRWGGRVTDTNGAWKSHVESY